MTDSLATGESFYLAEVRRIKDLLDEPFRGTNAHDAADATLAIVQRLATNKKALVFIASPITEVAPSIAGDCRVSLLHFSADLSNEEPTFDYTIRPGVSTQRLGMTLLKRERVLDLLSHGI